MKKEPSVSESEKEKKVSHKKQVDVRANEKKC